MCIQKLETLTKQNSAEGFWKCYHRIRNDDIIINHKRPYRIYKKTGLPLNRKVKKLLPVRVIEPLEVPVSFTKT